MTYIDESANRVAQAMIAEAHAAHGSGAITDQHKLAVEKLFQTWMVELMTMEGGDSLHTQIEWTSNTFAILQKAGYIFG